MVAQRVGAPRRRTEEGGGCSTGFRPAVGQARRRVAGAPCGTPARHCAIRQPAHATGAIALAGRCLRSSTDRHQIGYRLHSGRVRTPAGSQSRLRFHRRSQDLRIAPRFLPRLGQPAANRSSERRDRCPQPARGPGRQGAQRAADLPSRRCARTIARSGNPAADKRRLRHRHSRGRAGSAASRCAPRRRGRFGRSL